jgi:hypothetical protein
MVELRGIELEGQELGGLEEEAIALPPSRRQPQSNSGPS